jgi:hypothetical protein
LEGQGPIIEEVEEEEVTNPAILSVVGIDRHDNLNEESSMNYLDNHNIYFAI